MDSAAMYVNTSTSVTDGVRIGLDAEVTISTQRLPAREPMVLRKLSTEKCGIWGDNQGREEVGLNSPLRIFNR